MNAPVVPFADDRQRQDALIAHLVGAGYARCEPSLLQPAAAFLEADEALRGRLYLTHDLSGNGLCLRPSYTIPVCRHYIASGAFGKPAAYSYCGPVFRLRKDGPGEVVQAGIENFGRMDREAADAEVLALSLEAASLITPAPVETTIGDAGLVSDLLDALAIPLPWRSRIARGLAHGESFGLLDAPGKGATDPSGIEAEARLVLERYFAIDCDPDEAASALRALAEDAKLDIGPALERFEHRLGFIAARGIAIGEMRFVARFVGALDTYSGFVFETRDAAKPNDPPIVGGGRYDRLMTTLGAKTEVPAVGAALWADRRGPGASS